MIDFTNLMRRGPSYKIAEYMPDRLGVAILCTDRPSIFVSISPLAVGNFEEVTITDPFMIRMISLVYKPYTPELTW